MWSVCAVIAAAAFSRLPLYRGSAVWLLGCAAALRCPAVRLVSTRVCAAAVLLVQVHARHLL
eukprot:SAG25_NODE_10177_length_343_cov_2.434426_1_plen_61_part_10